MVAVVVESDTDRDFEDRAFLLGAVAVATLAIRVWIPFVRFRDLKRMKEILRFAKIANPRHFLKVTIDQEGERSTATFARGILNGLDRVVGGRPLLLKEGPQIRTRVAIPIAASLMQSHFQASMREWMVQRPTGYR